MNDDLKSRQDAGKEVEEKMLEFLLSFSPAQEMKICDAQTVARFARNISFHAFDPANFPGKSAKAA